MQGFALSFSLNLSTSYVVDSYENLLKAMNHKKKTQESSADPKTMQPNKGKRPKQQGLEGEPVLSKKKKSDKKTQEDDTEKKRKGQEREVKREKREEKEKREAVQR